MVRLREEADSSIFAQRRKLEHELREFEDNARDNTTACLSSRVNKRDLEEFQSRQEVLKTRCEAPLAE